MLHKILLIISIFGSFSCSTDNREANKRAVENFRTQIIESKFEEIYNSSKDNIKHYISKEEFLHNIKIAVEAMREFDDSLVWQQDERGDEFRNDRTPYKYENTSIRTMEKNGRKLTISIHWSDFFTFCDLIINEDFTDKPEIVVTRCSKQ